MPELIEIRNARKVSLKLIKKYMNMDPAPGDRPLRESRMQAYRRMFDQDKFRSVVWTYCNCVEVDSVFRVNGKHTANLFQRIWEDTGELPDLYVTEEGYTCVTLQEVSELYATYDSKLMTRHLNDIVLSFSGTIEGIHKIKNNSSILSASRGLSYYFLGQNRSFLLPVSERAELVCEHSDFLFWYSNLVEQGEILIGNRAKMKSPHIRAQPIVGAIVGSWMKSKRSACEFWSEVRDQSATNRFSGSRQLALYLLQTSISSATRFDTYCRCIRAWNAWRDGVEVKRLVHRDGTPAPKIK